MYGASLRMGGNGQALPGSNKKRIKPQEFKSAEVEVKSDENGLLPRPTLKRGDR